jgi:hypothetical protein
MTDEVARNFSDAGCTGTLCAQSLAGGPRSADPRLIDAAIGAAAAHAATVLHG